VSGTAGNAVPAGGAPRILELGDYPMMVEGYPDTTDFWCTQSSADFHPVRSRDNMVTFRSLPRLARALRSQDYDLIVVQPPTFRPWHIQAISRSLFRRSALRGIIPYGRYFAHELLRGPLGAPMAIWDGDEPPFIYRHNVSLLDRATLFFKRELPPDHWRVFMATVHRKIPTPRFRMKEINRARVAKLRPISLGLPIGLDRMEIAPALLQQPKTADIFFTGRVKESTTVRQRGLEELVALRDKGYRVDIPQNNLPRDEFFRRCASAWLTWSPEGYGYECFRTYEAAIFGSVPVLNRSTVDGYKPLRHGEHCFYYDVEPGGLSRTLEAALADKPRLAAMAQAARSFVLAEHTMGALARYVAQTTLAQVRAAAVRNDQGA
jgi:hypothetical protein